MFDDVVRLITEARVGVSVKCIAGLKKKNEIKARTVLILVKMSQSSTSYLPELYYLVLLSVSMND